MIHIKHDPPFCCDVGFTLIEMLVVISIIGILAAMILPALSKAKNRGTMMTDVNNLREQTMAMHLYSSDNQDYLPWPNWFANGTPRPGWLYAYDSNAVDHTRFKVETGLFWPTLHNPALYFCPMEDTNSALFAQRDEQISSYVMNGAVNGYSRKLFPCVKLGKMKPDAVVIWETDEMEPHYFNDGASFPSEGVSARHLQGAMTGKFDGSADYIKFDQWYEWAADTNKNQLWCYPDSDNGR